MNTSLLRLALCGTMLLTAACHAQNNAPAAITVVTNIPVNLLTQNPGFESSPGFGSGNGAYKFLGWTGITSTNNSINPENVARDFYPHFRVLLPPPFQT